MTKLLLQLRYGLLLWSLFFASGLVPQSAFGNNAYSRASAVYDGASFLVLDYDSASTLSANESENRIREEGGVFAQFAKFLAAEETTATQLEFQFAKDVGSSDVTYLYQKVGAQGEHLKFGITDNPATRYTVAELNGGSLRIIGQGERSEMLSLERQLHETLPIGPEDRQLFYIQKQVQKGLKPPPY